MIKKQYDENGCCDSNDSKCSNKNTTCLMEMKQEILLKI
jgi:hypothetical protein